jgi:hypothetical protein
MFEDNFETKLNCTELAVCISFKSLACGLPSKKKTKITPKSQKSDTELPEAIMPDVEENPLTQTPQLFSWEPKSR